MKKIISIFTAIVFAFSILIYRPDIIQTQTAHAAVELTPEQIANYFSNRVGESYASNMCLAFVADGFAALGGTRSSACCAWNYGTQYLTSTSRDIPIGADVFFSSEGCKYDYIDGNGHHSGHIGVYVGDGYIVHAYSSKIQKMLISTVENHGYTYWGWGIHGGISLTLDRPIGHEMNESEAAGRTIPDGVYCIGSALGDTLFVDPAPGSDIPAPSTANVALWSYDAGTLPDVQDQWAFTYNNGFYTISQYRSAEKGREMCLDVYNGEQCSGTNVWMYESNQSSAQQWSVRKTDTGYSIQSKRNGFFLDVQDGKAEKGNNLQVCEGNDTLSQRFRLISPIPPAPKLTITYHSNGGRTATDSAYYVADNDSLIYQNDSKKQYSTIWELGKGSVNGLRNASSFGLQREHYSFVGWSLSKDGSSTIFDQDDTSLTTKNLCPDLSKDTTIKVYAIWTRVSQRGDLNEDDKVNYTDLDLLTKCLLGDSTVTIADPNAADFNGDGALNGIDLTLLKRQILIDESIVITMNKSSIKLNTQGESKTYQLSTSYISPEDVVWKSSNPSIATVSANGLVTAQKDGKVIVTANVNGESLACSVEVITAFTESWSEPSKWDKTPIEGSDTRRVTTDVKPEPQVISINFAYCCARTKGDKIRQFYKDPVDVVALDLDTGYGLNTTQNVFGVPYITKSLAEVEQATKIQNNERSYGDQWGYNRSGKVGYNFDNGCIWFEVGRNTETVMVTYYSYEDLIQTPVVYDNN